MLIIRANVWRLIDALTEANYFFSKAYFAYIMADVFTYIMAYAIHFTNNVRHSQAFNWVILSQIIQLIQGNETSHDSTEWGCCMKVCAKREVVCKGYLP